MANLALVTADKIHIATPLGNAMDKLSAPAAVAITAGQAIQLNSSGKWALAKATTAALARRVYIADRTVLAGQSVTGYRYAQIDGFDVSALAYNAQIFLSDTDGALADAAGTVSTVVGHVIAGWAQPLGTAADKIIAFQSPVN